jgi:hypothetical protein
MKLSHLHKIYLKDIQAGIIAVTVAYALSYLPFSDVLQAIWILLSSIYLSTRRLKSRLNEGDELRHKRLQEERFAFWQKKDPETLKTLFSQNLTTQVLTWIDEELDIQVSDLDEIHALDSLSHIQETPGRLILRAGFLLGAWNTQWHTHQLNELTDQDPTERSDEFINQKRSYIQECLQAWIQEHRFLLGEEITEGTYLCHIGKDQLQRPIGIHLLTPESKILLSLETHSVSVELNDDDSQSSESTLNQSVDTLKSISLSLQSSFTQSLSKEEWSSFKDQLFKIFPMFKRINGGSGSQSQHIPFFIQPQLKADYNEAQIRELLNELSGIYQG